jgi:hypothetical protein
MSNAFFNCVRQNELHKCVDTKPHSVQNAYHMSLNSCTIARD